jgi:uncharacterized protein (DUF1684 family)
MNARLDWQSWADARDVAAAAPYGALALTATHWLTEETPLDGLPGTWSPAPEATGLVRVKASVTDGLVADGTVVDGTALLRPDTHPERSTVTFGELRLIPIEREGVLAVRVYDPTSPALLSFAGVDRYDYDSTLAVPAVYTAYSAPRTEKVPNADGRERGLSLTGDLEFELAGESHKLAVGTSGDGLSLVFGDTTNGATTYGFRFLTIAAPDEANRTVIDFNRAYLPPCAFSDHFICPLPPSGNRLTVPVSAGEKARRHE